MGEAGFDTGDDSSVLQLIWAFRGLGLSVLKRFSLEEISRSVLFSENYKFKQRKVMILVELSAHKLRSMSETKPILLLYVNI
jgi:hypothetical protein